MYQVKDESSICSLAMGCRLKPGMEEHDWSHTLRTVYLAKLIAANSVMLLTSEAARDIVISAYFHDVGRTKDRQDIAHGFEGAAIAAEIVPMAWPDADINSIYFAIANHHKRKGDNGGFPISENFRLPGKVNHDIASCLWDADRLDLLRYSYISNISTLEGIPQSMKTVSRDYLSTDYAKWFANSDFHRRLYINENF